jgi:crotonobetainyl-CoA:carnitine CoA-transferase CaiB-like acyl-CoA transferase
MQSIEHFYSDLTIVEMASVLAGPSVGTFFAERGARVIKIENATTGGDVTRNWRLPTESRQTPVSAYYASVNYGKQVFYKDLNLEGDLKEVKNWIAKADIVISNYSKEFGDKHGLGGAQLLTQHPQLIFAHLSGFGEEDTRPAFDIVLQAESGYLSMCGTPQGDPVKLPVALIDVMAAHQLKEGILTALWRREKTQKGALVSTSLLKAALSALMNQASNWLMEGFIPGPLGTLHPNIAPYGEIFSAKDHKKMVLAIGTEKQFLSLCQCLSVPDMAEDPKFNTNSQRVINRNELQGILAPLFLEKEREEWMKIFLAQKIPAGALKNLPEVMQNPIAQSMLLKETIQDQETLRLSSIAFDILEN